MQSGSCLNERLCSSECSLQTLASSKDQKSCIPCGGDDSALEHADGSISYDVNFKDCVCNNPVPLAPANIPIRNQKVVELYSKETGEPLRKECVPCPKGTAVISQNLIQEGENTFYTAGARFDPDPYTCATCPDPNMLFDLDYQCKCIEGMFFVGEGSIGEQKCIKHMPSISTEYSKVNFHFISQNGERLDKKSLNSIVLSHHYLHAASNCEFARDSHELVWASCQTLANLCVLTLYDTNSAPCLEFQSIISNKRMSNYHGQEDWKLFMPWLYYLDDADDVGKDQSLQMKVSFWDLKNHQHYMDFRLFKYTIDGDFIGMEKLTDQLIYCSSTSDEIKRNSNEAVWFQFGNTMRLESKCSIKSLIESEMYFYDLYIVDGGINACPGNTVDGLCLYPVPVLLRNLVDGESFPNFNTIEADEYNDVFTRRFFFFDNLVRILKFIEAIFFIVSGNSRSNIFEQVWKNKRRSKCFAICIKNCYENCYTIEKQQSDLSTTIDN